MKTSPIIYCTPDYGQFQFYPSNRPIFEAHVTKLMESKFPDKFHTCPITVNGEHFIIDGQHRYTAAKRLGIPIYYIIDRDATESDILQRNAVMKNWRTMDFVHYFAQTNDTYKFIQEMYEKYSSLSPSFHLNIISRVANCELHRFSNNMKAGTLVLSEEDKRQIVEFYNVYVPFVKELKSVRGKDSMPYFQRAYIACMIQLHESDDKTFNKIIKKALITSLAVPSFAYPDDAMEYLLKVSNWRPSRAGFKANADWDIID